MRPKGSGFVSMAANQDIVSTANLDCKLILEDIALNARNAEYNPEICTGAESEEQSMLAARKYAHIIQKLGFPVKFKDFKIVGGSGGLGMPEDIAPAVAFLAGEVNGQIN